VYIYINIFFIVLLLIIITEKVHIKYAYRIIAGRNDKEKKNTKEIEKRSEAAILMRRFWKKNGVKTKIEIQ